MKDIIPTEKQYKFRSGDDGLKLLLCPACGEPLTASDIELYFKCPYCDHKLFLNTELEDFILSPVVDTWTQQQNPLGGSTARQAP